MDFLSGAFGGNRGVRPVPPEKGVFPLDHMHLCDLEKKEYINCLKYGGHKSEKCRHFSKTYLECRMEKVKRSWEEAYLEPTSEIYLHSLDIDKITVLNLQKLKLQKSNLMAKQDMSELGFGKGCDLEASEEKK
ncbi:hypothetical protein HYC85_012240 [Camellia sinensis]|uniref:CHCH domain-containing protein n=1 Tax=Camellia sinensis TaxID=4442 RepID=A0A7J7HCN4_CAMSI|nr:hypothetical protein HYC85_012240 [Camellia sinensis]